MEVTVQCPSCGGRTTAEARELESPGHVVCPYCQREIPLGHGADAMPKEPADGAS